MVFRKYQYRDCRCIRKVTLNGKGSVVIKATSGDKQTVSYTIKAPSYMIKVDKQAYYADAMSICKNLLPSTQTVLSDIYDSWGLQINIAIIVL